MKKLFVLFFLFFLYYGLNAQPFWTLDFESAGGYTTNITELSDNYYDFFTRTDGSNIGSGYVVGGIQGSYYFAAQDIDGDQPTLPVTLTIDDINIFGLSNIQFSIFLAEDDDGTNQDWDNFDYVHIDYDIDNSGTFTNLIHIENDGTQYNTAPLIDTDFDGNGDGTEITSTFTEFIAAINGTGGTLDIRITFWLDSGDEDIAIDNLSLSVSGPPSPAVSVAPTTLTGFTYIEGSGPSTSQSFNVSGSNLTADISIAPPANYEISTDNTNFQSTTVNLTQSSGTVNSTPVYARLEAGLPIGTFNNQEITLTSTDATNQTVTCSGTVTSPVILPNAWINEIHYDNDGTDVDEMVEVVIEKAGDYNLADFTITLYNGNGGASYDTKTLDMFTVGDVVGDFSFFYYSYPSNGIQNGNPDGLALDWDGNIIQFLSYEGTFTATNGPANGSPSTDIGVSEGSKPIGQSLQLYGIGLEYNHFAWVDPLANPGRINNNQFFGTPPPPVPFNWRYILLLFFILSGTLIYRKIR